MRRITPIVEVLIFLNIISLFAQYFLGINMIEIFGLRYFESVYFRPYQIVTHLFVHASFLHLFNNMFALYTLGPVLETTLRPKRFLLFYLFTGIGAAALSSLVQYADIHRISTLYHEYCANPNPDRFQSYIGHFSQSIYRLYYNFSNSFFNFPTDVGYIEKSKSIAKMLYLLKVNIPTVGASGVIFGILVAFAMLFPNAELFLFFIPIPIKAKYFVLVYSVYELYASLEMNSSDNIAHIAHVGGVLFGYLFIKMWKKKAEFW